MLASHLCICLPQSVVSSGFLTKTLCAFHLSCICATCQARVLQFSHLNNTGTTSTNHLQPLPSLFPILDPSIFPSNLVSNVFSQCNIPSFTPIDNNRQNHRLVCFNLRCLTADSKTENCGLNSKKNFLQSNCSYFFFINEILISYMSFPKILTRLHFQRI